MDMHTTTQGNQADNYAGINNDISRPVLSKPSLVDVAMGFVGKQVQKLRKKMRPRKRLYGYGYYHHSAYAPKKQPMSNDSKKFWAFLAASSVTITALYMYADYKLKHPAPSKWADMPEIKPASPFDSFNQMGGLTDSSSVYDPMAGWEELPPLPKEKPYVALPVPMPEEYQEEASVDVENYDSFNDDVSLYGASDDNAKIAKIQVGTTAVQVRWTPEQEQYDAQRTAMFNSMSAKKGLNGIMALSNCLDDAGCELRVASEAEIAAPSMPTPPQLII